MIKKNFIAIFALAFALVFLPITAYAAESSNYNNDTIISQSETLNQLIYDYGAKVSSHVSYTSKMFRPETNRVSILFGNWGAFGTYTYYLEEQNPNGTWTKINSNTIRYCSTISTSANVTPNNLYRVTVTTTNNYTDQISLEVFEYIYD